jgi:hypothetical protein
MFKIYEFIDERGNTVSHTLPYNCHFNDTELVLAPDYNLYNSNIGRNGSGMQTEKRRG